MKKIIGVVIGMLLFGTILTQVALAGDEDHPDLVDDSRDVKVILKIGTLHGPTAEILFKNIDILSAWFWEDASQPENLYVTLKMGNVRVGLFSTTYLFDWQYDGKYCFACVGHNFLSNHWSAEVGYEDEEYYNYETNAVIDYKKNTITVTVPKEYVADPQPGTVIQKTYAATFIYPPFPLVIPFAYDETIRWSSTNYIIQY